MVLRVETQVGTPSRSRRATVRLPPDSSGPLHPNDHGIGLINLRSIGLGTKGSTEHADPWRTVKRSVGSRMPSLYHSTCLGAGAKGRGKWFGHGMVALRVPLLCLYGDGLSGAP